MILSLYRCTFAFYLVGRVAKKRVLIVFLEQYSRSLIKKDPANKVTYCEDGQKRQRTGTFSARVKSDSQFFFRRRSRKYSQVPATPTA